MRFAHNRMWWLALVFVRARTEECPSAPFEDGREFSAHSSPLSSRPIGVPRPPRSSPALADIVGLDEAKAVLREAVVLPSSVATSVARLFWCSGERSAVLLAGPSGLGKRAAAEAAAAAAGAQILPLLATEVDGSNFCRIAVAAASAAGHPVVVIIEALEAAPGAALTIRQCLREPIGADDARLFIVATMGRDIRHVSASVLAPFGYIARLELPNEAERKQFLLRLLAHVSRVDPQWASALRESAVATLASLTANYTFAEIDFVVRRAFIRSTNDEGIRDPVALHHFEQILAETPAQAVNAFNETIYDAAVGATGEVRTGSVDGKKKSKDVKDPMDGIFGWCNMWLPEALHLPPVVWAMIIFGILAHFMARSTYQPYGHRKRRGGAGARSSLFSDIGSGPNPYSSFGDQLNDWYPGGSPFAHFPPPPGMSRVGESAAGPNKGTGPEEGNAPAESPTPAVWAQAETPSAPLQTQSQPQVQTEEDLQPAASPEPQPQ